jgi:ATP synthase F1 gamma subunit
MLNKKQLADELELLGAFRTVTETYTEIAAKRMQRVRDNVVKNRDFIEEVLTIFQDLRSSYKEQIQKIMKARHVSDISRLTAIKHNGKTAYVFVSASGSFYGDIIRRIFEEFKENLGRQADFVVIGKSGKAILAEEGITANYTFFDLPDEATDLAPVKAIISFLVPYEKVIVHYGKFENLITQSPVATDITGNQTSARDSLVKTSYLVEPTLEETLSFFATEIFSSLFVQSLQENDLAKLASRMFYMDQANLRIRHEIGKTEFARQRLRHQLVNRKQLQLMGSLRMWIK